jgi:Fe-S-cluster containining protein
LFKFLKKEGKINIKKGEYDPYYPYDMVANGICPFFEEEMRVCKIYNDHRPSICMKFECSQQNVPLH